MIEHAVESLGHQADPDGTPLHLLQFFERRPQGFGDLRLRIHPGFLDAQQGSVHALVSAGQQHVADA